MSDTLKTRPVLLILASTFPRWQGDPEPGFIHELAKRLVPYFHVIVLCPHARGAKVNEQMDGVEVIRYRYAPEQWETLVNDGGIVTNLRNHRWKIILVPSFAIMQAWQVWRVIRARQLNVVHAHWLVPQGLIAAIMQKISGHAIPFLVTSHGADLFALRGGLLQKLKKFVLGRAHGATVVSTAMLSEVRRIGADTSKVSVLPMGVDMMDRFVPGDQQERSDNELLFVGRLVEKKGLRYLLSAMPSILKVRPDATLTIAGFGPDETALRIQAKELGIEQQIRFLGAVPQADLPALYQRAALFVAPFVRAESGDQEGLPVALMEAIACGCPCIAGNVDGLQDIFGSDAESCVVNPRVPEELVSAILRQLNDRESAVRLVMKLRAGLVEHLSWASIADRYATLLRDAALK